MHAQRGVSHAALGWAGSARGGRPAALVRGADGGVGSGGGQVARGNGRGARSDGGSRRAGWPSSGEGDGGAMAEGGVGATAAGERLGRGRYGRGPVRRSGAGRGWRG